MKDNVYHASKNSGLKSIEPRISSHNRPWVYATKDIASAAIFLGNNYDYICQSGTEGTLPQIFERFEGAFEVAYKEQSGSIYTLAGTNFKEGLTSWPGEVVSELTEQVIAEMPVDNVENLLEKLASENKLKIYKYPNIPQGYPTDKSDIVKRGVIWTINYGEKTLEQVEKYHPDVLYRVLQELKKQNYVFESDKWDIL